MLALKKKSDGLTIFEDAEEVYQAAEELKSQLDTYINNHNDSPVMDEIMDFYFEIVHFIDIYEGLDDKYVIYGHMTDGGDYLLKLFTQLVGHQTKVELFLITYLMQKVYH